MKRIFFLFVCVIVGIVVGSIFLTPHSNKTALTQKPLAQNTNDSLTPTIQNGESIIPESISIPKININTHVEQVGMDSQGRMDVPSNNTNVAWYSPGHKPGSGASAVIDGHYDTVTGAPAVFYNLDKLTPGDKIMVSDSHGTTLTFAVTEKKLYPFDQFPLEQVFNSTDKSRLNLITCDGVWDQKTKNYSQRLVVYAELVS
jgi:LPXTG-site transpeptidase (sortase) family protein